jgi:hypothetical protein
MKKKDEFLSKRLKSYERNTQELCESWALKEKRAMPKDT